MEAPAIAALQYYYDKQEVATRECLLALKSIIMSVDKDIVHIRKYQIPFFCYNEFNLGFLWVHKKKIIVGFVEDKKVLPAAITGRKKDNVFTMEINPLEDIPVAGIKQRLNESIDRYKKNVSHPANQH